MMNGLAFGGAAVLASSLDMRIGCEDTKFRFLAAAYGRINSTWSLGAQIGWPMAKELLFTARIVEAEEAYRIGLLNHLVPRAKLRDKTMEIARMIAGNHRGAVIGVKAVAAAAEGREPGAAVRDRARLHHACDARRQGRGRVPRVHRAQGKGADLMAIKYEKRDGVAYITLNNPAKANIFDKETSDEISEAWIDMWEDRDIRCAILTGAGDRYFCGGHNLAPRKNITEEEREYLRTQRIFWPLAGTVHGQKTGVDGRFGDHYPRVWKPVIAAVNGWAAGAGLYVLLSSTDIRIASAEHARFKFSLLSQGWIGHGPGASLLIKQLRYADAMKILLTDEPFDAQEALRIGLVNEVVPHAQLMERAEKIRAAYRQAAAGRGAHDEGVRGAVRRSADRPGLARADPDEQPADPGDHRRRGRPRRRSTPSARRTSPARCGGVARRGRSRPRKMRSGWTRRIAAASSELFFLGSTTGSITDL